MVSGVVKLLFLLTAYSITCHALDWQDDINNVTITVKEISGLITIRNYYNSITLGFDRLFEVADNGETHVGIKGKLKHRFHNFLGQKFSFSPSRKVKIAGKDFALNKDRNISAISKNISTILIGPDVDFNVELTVFDNDTIVQHSSGERYQVYNGTVQLSVTIGRWKFCGANIDCLKNGVKEKGEFLNMYVNVSGTNLNYPKVVTDLRGTNVFGDKPKTFLYGGSDVTFSRKYLQNGTWRKIPNNYPKPIPETSLAATQLPRFPLKFPVTYSFYVNLDDHKYVKPSSSTILVVQTAAMIFWTTMGLMLVYL